MKQTLNSLEDVGIFSQIVQFDNVITNVGSGYNEDKGVFTAPVRGYYQFHVHAHTIVNKQAEVRVMVFTLQINDDLK